MKILNVRHDTFYFYAITIFIFLYSSYSFSQEIPKQGPNSDVYEGIQHGKLTKYKWKSKVFPNTIRDYYIYVPAQYQPSHPAALMIFQDGHAYADAQGEFKVPVVFDNLIAQGKMPITIGLFIDPGHSLDSLQIESPWQASNRSVEYDTVSEMYGKFLLEEMIPEIKKNYTISEDPKLRAVAGISSGGICAFTAAWFYPDQFQKVMSHIGSFTDIRQGHNYPSMIRKNDQKNIKVYLQDGSNDLNNQYGDWWLANLQMESALKYKGYEYKFEKGTGGHNGIHGAAVLPQSLVWLWDDMVPKRVEAGIYQIPNEPVDSIIVSGETMHFSEMEFIYVQLSDQFPARNVFNAEKEQIFIVEDGEVQVKVHNKIQTIGKNSVLVLLPGDKGYIKSITPKSAYYTMIYKAKSKKDSRRGKKNGGSTILDFSELEFKEHDKGGIRNYFHRSTAMCPYYEMHVTSLNAGIKSHEPHTHFATEIVLVIKGNTEMEIGNEIFRAKKGDFYYLLSNVPHAIRNIGSEQCEYFAFQWN